MPAYVRSILSADGVSELIREQFGLEAVSVTLVRSLVNEVYRVDTHSGRFAFKVYRTSEAPRAHSLEAVAWEQDLAAHLIQAGMRVPAPVALLTGDRVGRLAAPEGPRPLSGWESIAETTEQVMGSLTDAGERELVARRSAAALRSRGRLEPLRLRRAHCCRLRTGG